MATYPYKCDTCGEKMDIEARPSTVKSTYRKKCPKCEKQRTFSRDWSQGIAAVHLYYSPMHPRANRGKG